MYVVQLSVTSSAAPVPGCILVVENTVTDLAVDGFDPTANSKTFYPEEEQTR